ncbi:unnamed protein product [Gongylonema pulchrum]|uniref:T-complex protein 11-like protein 1 n=1 Tax=Gongylonema pulchrum TaxID=637853 RepID=A0A183DYW7_9BILA|nr:unnamed protein product [Gongylonema pulchrum]
MVLDLLLPHHVRLRAEVESMLDLDLLKQQVENKCLDVQPLFENIIGLLRRLCAPSRDELLNNLLTKSDKVDMLRGICDVIEIMKVDMANFYVNSNRSVVEQHSIEYERMQFAKILQRNPDLEVSILEWLKRHLITDELPSSAKKRFELIISTSCVLVSCNLAGKDVAQARNFKSDLSSAVIVITNDMNKSNMKDRLEAVSVYCDDKISKCCKTLNTKWSEEQSNELKEQIAQIADAENRIRKLIREL